MPQTPVPEIVVERLPLYLRTLSFLKREGKVITSSQELGARLGFTSAQIRKDLSYFGEFGKQGTGYNISFLEDQLRKILHVDHVWDVVVIGAGDLGRALVHYRGFDTENFRLVAIFDNAPQKIGTRVDELTVQNMFCLPQVIQDKNIKVVILAVPAQVAQQVTNTVVELGVRAILNYAPITLTTPKNVRVYYIDPVTGLQSMAYYL